MLGFLFKKRKPVFFELKNKIELNNAVEFLIPDDKIYIQLKYLLNNLKECEAFDNLELTLKNKSFTIEESIDNVTNNVWSDLIHNYKEYTTEFKDSSLKFSYFIGKDILHLNAIEIIQKIYEPSNESSELIYSLVVKRSSDKFVYWKWQ